MTIAEMNMEELEARSAEIMASMEERTGEELEALKREAQEIAERRAELKEFEERQAQAKALENGEAQPAKVVEKSNTEERKEMTEMEIRSSVEYGKAFLKGIKSDDYSECRSLMTVNGTVGENPLNSNTIPVPTFLDNEIKTAWEEHQIASLVKKTYQKGIVKCVFEVSATGASIHVEGTGAPEEEKIVLGAVELIPANIKKWITVTDEAIEGTTIDTIGYLYKEIAAKIVEKAEEEIVNNIVNAQATTDATHAGVPQLAQNIAVDTILNAEALLSGQAKNLNVIMNRQTYPAFVKLALEAGYAIDVFDGLKDKIVFSDKLPAFSTASNGAVYAIVGDLGYGYQANFPNGNDITIKRDDLSLAELDLVKLVGKQYVGHGVVAPKAIVNIKKVPTA